MRERTGERDIIADLAGAPVDLRSLARRRGVTLDELAALASSDGVLDCLRRLGLVHDACARLAMGRERMRAIRTLADDGLTEARRKACVDLIKLAPAPLALDGHASDQASAGDQTAQAIDDATAELLRRALDAYAKRPPVNDEEEDKEGGGSTDAIDH